MKTELKLCINKLLFAFNKAFINNSNELIIEPKNNIYFRMDDVENKLDFDCKVIAWLSRPSIKGVSTYWQQKIRKGFNYYFDKKLTKEQIDLIYTRLGNDINRKLCIKFIESDFDLKLLEYEGYKKEAKI